MNTYSHILFSYTRSGLTAQFDMSLKLGARASASLDFCNIAHVKVGFISRQIFYVRQINGDKFLPEVLTSSSVSFKSQKSIQYTTICGQTNFLAKFYMILIYVPGAEVVLPPPLLHRFFDTWIYFWKSERFQSSC